MDSQDSKRGAAWRFLATTILSTGASLQAFAQMGPGAGLFPGQAGRPPMGESAVRRMPGGQLVLNIGGGGENIMVIQQKPDPQHPDTLQIMVNGGAVKFDLVNGTGLMSTRPVGVPPTAPTPLSAELSQELAGIGRDMLQAGATGQTSPALVAEVRKFVHDASLAGPAVAAPQAPGTAAPTGGAFDNIPFGALTDQRAEHHADGTIAAFFKDPSSSLQIVASTEHPNSDPGHTVTRVTATSADGSQKKLWSYDNTTMQVSTREGPAKAIDAQPEIMGGNRGAMMLLTNILGTAARDSDSSVSPNILPALQRVVQSGLGGHPLRDLHARPFPGLGSPTP